MAAWPARDGTVGGSQARRKPGVTCQFQAGGGLRSGGAFLLGVIWVVVPSTAELPTLVAYAVFLMSGGIVVWLLSRNADPREGAGTDERPWATAPPPPPGAVLGHAQEIYHDTGNHDDSVKHLLVPAWVKRRPACHA